MKSINLVLAGVLAAAGPAGHVHAQAEDAAGSGAAAEEFADVPLPPELPDPIESGQAIEPEVSIIRTEEKVIEEYRVNGHLYMVKITPVVGRPYYLIDQDGDGQMEGRISDIYNTPRVPQWVLFSW
jgi:hypothetical protein